MSKRLLKRRAMTCSAGGGPSKFPQFSSGTMVALRRDERIPLSPLPWTKKGQTSNRLDLEVRD
jgi:hypothetical protein